MDVFFLLSFVRLSTKSPQDNMKKNYIWDEMLPSSACFSQEIKSDVYFKV